MNDDFTMVKNGITTAYAEGASLTLTCTATGGKPLAKVRFYSNITLLCGGNELKVGTSSTLIPLKRFKLGFSNQ